jgi:Protein of unknown function (DUF3775)
MTESNLRHDSFDPFFEVVPDSNWNACIGQQGEERNYIDGFMEAAIELVGAIFDKKLMSQRDTLVLPILYNARHAVELSLKFAINRLHNAGMIATCHPANHHIHSHWKHLHDSNLGDRSLRECIANLEPFVVSLAKIDDDGQELRYSENKAGQQSLASHAVANLRLIRCSLNALGEILKCLQRRVVVSVEERGTGSFTTRCSRQDLLNIAEMLPHHRDWCDFKFDQCKTAIKEKFGLSNGQFSKALGVLQSNREMKILIGLETGLMHLSDDHVILVVEEWRKRHPAIRAESELDMDIFAIDREAMDEYRQIANRANDVVFGTLSPDEIADLETLFYLGRDHTPSEYYEEDLKRTKRKNRCRSDVKQSVDRMMEKTNLLKALANGIAIVGRPSLAVDLKHCF